MLYLRAEIVLLMKIVKAWFYFSHVEPLQWWVPRCLILLAIWMFVQMVIQAYNKENSLYMYIKSDVK